MAGLDGELSGVHRDVAEPSRAIAGRRIDSLRSGRRQRDPQSTRRRLRGISLLSKDASSTNSEIYAELPSKSRVTRLRLQTMKAGAYKCKSALTRRASNFQALVSWLERNGYDPQLPEAFAKGLEETLTVVKLRSTRVTFRDDLWPRQTPSRNLNGTIRRVSRNARSRVVWVRSRW